MSLRPSDIHPRDLARKALEIAEARPMHQYKVQGDPQELGSCVYVDPVTLEGSCLFGQAFVALGVDPASLLPVNEHGIESLLGDREGGEFARLGNAQGCQDVGFVWGSEGVRGEILAFLEERA